MQVAISHRVATYFLELTDLSDTFSLLFNTYNYTNVLTLLLGDKQARGIRWEVDTMVYGIPSHIFVTKQQSCFLKYLLISNIHFN